MVFKLRFFNKYRVFNDKNCGNMFLIGFFIFSIKKIGYPNNFRKNRIFWKYGENLSNFGYHQPKPHTKIWKSNNLLFFLISSNSYKNWSFLGTLHMSDSISWLYGIFSSISLFLFTWKFGTIGVLTPLQFSMLNFLSIFSINLLCDIFAAKLHYTVIWKYLN